MTMSSLVRTPASILVQVGTGWVRQELEAPLPQLRALLLDEPGNPIELSTPVGN